MSAVTGRVTVVPRREIGVDVVAGETQPGMHHARIAPL